MLQGGDEFDPNDVEEEVNEGGVGREVLLELEVVEHAGRGLDLVVHKKDVTLGVGGRCFDHKRTGNAFLPRSKGKNRLNKATYPTEPFTTWELQHPFHDFPEQYKISRSPDLKAIILRKSRSG